MSDYRSRLDDIFGSVSDKGNMSRIYETVESLPRSAPAAPAAPTKPATTPKPTTPKPTPGTQPGRLPGKLPGISPKEVPHRAVVKEAYEEFVHPATRDLYTFGDERFGFLQHPMMSQHGEAIARKAYEHSSDKVYRAMEELRNLPAGRRQARLAQLSQESLMDIMRIERPHKAELERIAIDIVAKMYNIHDEDKSRLKAFLRKPQIERAAPEQDEEEERMTGELTDREDQINKRYTMNLLSQGAAIHNMHDVHLEEEIAARLTRLDPNLTRVYSQFGRGSSHMYWLYNINMILDASLGSAMGTASMDEEGNVIAQAPIFPVLVQELIKGVIMLISQHQFADMPPEHARQIIKAADTLHDEFPQIMVGPKVWKTFIKMIPNEYKNRLIDVVATLAKAHPRELNVLMVRLGQAIAHDEHPETSSAALALKDLLDRTLAVETPEDVASYIDDEPDYNFTSEEEPDEGPDGRRLREWIELAESEGLTDAAPHLQNISDNQPPKKRKPRSFSDRLKRHFDR